MLDSTYNGKAIAADRSALDRADGFIRELFQATPLYLFVRAAKTALTKRTR